MDSITYLVQAALSAIVVTLLLAWLFGTRRIRRIGQLLRAMERMNQELRLEIRMHAQAQSLLQVCDTQQRQLADEVEQRTQELERSNRELEQYAYVASHDLQAPLRSINGFVQLLERRLNGALDDTTREYMRYIRESVAGMQRLIEALLELGRIGRGGVKSEATDLRQALAEAQDRLHAQIEERHAHIDFDGGSLPTVLADKTLLVQLLQNLLSNAIKFQPRPRPEIHVEAYPRDGEWVVAVADLGIGIEAQHFQRIFQIFQRLHTAQEYEGSGIGLAICEKIVRLHGGRIWLESKPGYGSTFFFSLPQRPAPAEEPAEGLGAATPLH